MRLEKYLVVLTVFTVFMDDYRFGDEKNRAFVAFDFYYYYVIWLLFILYFIIKRKEIPFWPRWFLLGILALFTNSVFGGFASDSLKFSMVKQMLGITFSSIAYFSVIKYENFNLQKIFGYYLSGAFWVGLWGLGEQAMHIFRFTYWFGGSTIEDITRLLGFANFWENYKITSMGFNRVYSIMGEPYYLAVALLPAFVYYTNKMFGSKNFRDWKYKWRFGVITLCFLFTFSSAGYVGILMTGFFISVNRGFFDLRRFGLLFIPVFLIAILPNIAKLRTAFFELQVRVDDTVKAFLYKGIMDKKEIAKLNSSTFALYSNFLIAGKSFEAHPYTGSGLGSHEISYDRFFDVFLDKIIKKMYGTFNAKDGNSLFIRLVSEGGLIGLSIFFIALFYFFVYKRGIDVPELAPLTIINQAVFIMLVIRLLRTGNYIGQGFYFFFFLYALSAIQIRQYYKNQATENTSDSIPEA
ncbi:MAG: hypothetical protein FJ347_06180 [Sphingomonadales bacterium]|nr:hypothetical protein [Sphingomonadales bacterium]